MWKWLIQLTQFHVFSILNFMLIFYCHPVDAEINLDSHQFKNVFPNIKVKNICCELGYEVFANSRNLRELNITCEPVAITPLVVVLGALLVAGIAPKLRFFFIMVYKFPGFRSTFMALLGSECQILFAVMPKMVDKSNFWHLY